MQVNLNLWKDNGVPVILAFSPHTAKDAQIISEHAEGPLHQMEYDSYDLVYISGFFPKLFHIINSSG